MGYPWSSGDQLNAADLNDAIKARFASLVIGETVAVTDAVCYGLYQSDGGVLYDTSATASVTASGTTATVTNPITVGSNSNRILIVVAISAASGVSASWNGTSMTQIDQQQQSSGGSWMNTYYLIAPTTGAHNLVFTSVGSGASMRYFIYSYYNAKQSAQPDNHSITAGTTSVSSSITPTVPGTLVFGATWNQDSGTDTTTGVPNNQQTGNGWTGSTAQSMVVGDNGQIAPATSQTVSGTGSAGNRIIATAISIAPFTAASYRVRKASSALNNYKAQCFIGFPYTTGNTGDTKDIIIGGVVSGLSGLTPLAPYYLNDTNGTYGTSPGTVTRKIGFALDATTLFLTNEP